MQQSRSIDTPEQPDEWWLRGNFYSLYIDKFAGDIPGLIDRLDYFVALGVDCLHLLPFYQSPNCDGGYDITDHCAIDPKLGTLEDFKQLCDEAHARGLKIMVDLVLNHTSEEHPWFVEARSSHDNPKRDFYLWSKTREEYQDAPVIFSDFKDDNWIANPATDDYYYATFKPCQPDLNWQNPTVQVELFKVADTLASYGVDGFRLDAIMKLVERDHTTSRNLPETHERVKDLRAYLDQRHPGMVILAEVIDTTRATRTYFGAGNECHLSYNFEIMNEMFYTLLCGDRTDRLRTVVEAARRIPSGTSWMSFLRNHDSLSLAAIDEVRAERILQSINQTGGVLFNEGAETTQRLFNILNSDEQLVREAFSMLYALPTATVMYYGDEIGMQNSALPDGEDDARFLSRGVFDWDAAEQQMADTGSLWHHVKKCMRR